MRREELFLRDIVEAADHIAQFIAGIGRSGFQESELAFRNILVHAYFGIDWDEVWRAASKESPALRDQIESILRAEFGAKGDG